jgi:hypothetical protein
MGKGDYLGTVVLPCHNLKHGHTVRETIAERVPLAELHVAPGELPRLPEVRSTEHWFRLHFQDAACSQTRELRHGAAGDRLVRYPGLAVRQTP